MKFTALEVVFALENAVGSLADGQCIPIRLTGQFKEEFGEQSIEGQDVFVILVRWESP